MLTYTGRRNNFGDLCNNSSTATLTIADRLMNDSEKRIISAKDWPFLWRQYTKVTTTSQAINLPAYTSHPQSVYVTVGSYRYSPKEISTRTEWDRLNETVTTSDIPEYYFVYDGQLLLHPTPATAGNTVTFNARRLSRDLNVADYTIGTITTVATSGVTTTVTGSGTTWHTGMIGRYIRITDGDAANTLSGDHMWYEIATVPSSTTLTLTRTYGGTAMSGASATYTIGQVSLIPEPHNQLPVFEALKIYFTSIEPNSDKAQLYGGMFETGYAQMVRDFGSKVDVVLDDGNGQHENFDPNLHITL